jgi:uncharacterized protein YneF (UPF0154 family)
MKTRTLVILIIAVALLAGLYWFIRNKFFKPTWKNPEVNPSNVNAMVFPLKYGSKGKEVEIVQLYLNAVLPKPLMPLSIDGQWGPRTTERFQMAFPDSKSVNQTLYTDMYSYVQDYYKEELNEYWGTWNSEE